MDNDTTFVGLDVHKNTITAAVLPKGADNITEVKTIENTPEALKKMTEHLRGLGSLRFVYEAGPCGYDVHRQLVSLGLPCDVIAPSLTPKKPGDKVKTDRRDAEKLARWHRAGGLTVIRVPSREEEAARDLVRCREDALADRLRSRHRLGKFLLRQGRIFQGGRSWGAKHRQWLKEQSFEWASLKRSFEAMLRALHETEDRLTELDKQISELAAQKPYETPVRYLKCFRGIETLTAITLMVEVSDFKRFAKAPNFMGFTGMVSQEDSSASRVRRFSITRTGNAHLRRVLVEAAWHYRRPAAAASPVLRKRREDCPSAVLQIARKADARLAKRYFRLTSRGKPTQKAVVAVARELAGFIWAMAQHFPEA